MKKQLLYTGLALVLALSGGIFCRLMPQSGAENTAPALAATPITLPVILRSFPHDTAAFTQGLVYSRGLLYESDGIYGKSALRIVDTLGRQKKRLAVADVFAEGLACFGGRWLQLTWREGSALVYDSATLSPVGRFSYEGEGWGLAVDRGLLVMSNGSDSLYWRDPADFHVVRKCGVTLDGWPLRELNELEVARGLIWANIWQKDRIVAIDPQSGKVVKVVDCTELVRLAKTAYRSCDVLNGIAYDASRDLFFVTGKYWPLVFVLKM